MVYKLSVILFLSCFSVSAQYTPSSITVTGKVYNANGTLYNGSIATIKWPLIHSETNYTIVGATNTVFIVNGNFSWQFTKGYHLLKWPSPVDNTFIYIPNNSPSITNLYSVWSSYPSISFNTNNIFNDVYLLKQGSSLFYHITLVDYSGTKTLNIDQNPSVGINNNVFNSIILKNGLYYYELTLIDFNGAITLNINQASL